MIEKIATENAGRIMIDYRYNSDVTFDLTQTAALGRECRDAFIAGAQWLMQQPLSDRLTDEEKEKIKETYKSLCRKIANNELPSDYRDCATAQMLLLESIFGKELFNEK